MKLPRIRIMQDLFLGIGLLAAIIAIGVWLFHFHLSELLAIYGISIVGIIAYVLLSKTRKRW